MYCLTCKKKAFVLRQRKYRNKKKYCGGRPLDDDCFPVGNEAFLHKDMMCRYLTQEEYMCDNCGCVEVNRDYVHGEIVCKKCGLIIDIILTHF